MSVVTIASILVSLCAFFAYFNHLVLKLPNVIGIMVSALVFSLLILLLHGIGIDLHSHVEHLLNSIDFTETLMNGMLSFLLFAGALNVDLESLATQKWIVGILASIGTIFSTILVGYASYYIFGLLGFDIPLIYALVFGALISPTDPIAVLAILKRLSVKKSLETKIVGESLFNDGIAVVIFVSLLNIATTGNSEASSIIKLFLQEAVGGAVFGFLLGYVFYHLLKSIDDYSIEVLLTLALVMGGYELAHFIHVSGPITMVIAGLFIGNKGRKFAMSKNTVDHLDKFWELIDEFFNAVLFLLVGLEILLLSFDSTAIQAGLIMIPVLLTIRLLSVAIPVYCLKFKREFSPNVIKILTWGGLRGGISVALVLSLPDGEIRDFLLVVTYCIVVFSIIVQGLTIEKLLK